MNKCWVSNNTISIYLNRPPTILTVLYDVKIAMLISKNGCYWVYVCIITITQEHVNN